MIGWRPCPGCDRKCVDEDDCKHAPKNKMLAEKAGYYGCCMPPGYCGCPQDVRKNCRHGRWVKSTDVMANEQ